MSRPSKSRQKQPKPHHGKHTQSTASTSRSCRKSKFSCRISSLFLKIFLYYTIFLALWRCKKSPDPSDPALCVPIRSVCSTISPIIAPYVEPAQQYYSAHAKPHVDALVARVEPRAAATKAFIESKYDSKIAPAIAPYVQKARDYYSLHIDPHVLAASNWYASNIEPTIKSTQEKLQPLCASIRNQSAIAYEKTLTFVVHPGLAHASTGIAHAQSTLIPAALEHLKAATNYSLDQIKRVWTVVVVGHVSPRVSQVYHQNVEPQVVKVIDRIFQNGGEDDKSETLSLSEKVTVSSTDSADFIQEKDVSSEASLDESTVPSQPPASSAVSSEPPASSSVASEPPASSSSSPSQKTDSRKPLKFSFDEELNNWKRVVGFTTSQAIAEFLQDTNAEKARLIEEARPEFTRLLQALQKRQHTGYVELKKLINDLESKVNAALDDKSETHPTIPYTPESIQAVFKEHAAYIRDATKAVHKYAEEFAQSAIDNTEKIRTATIDTLDEFADVTLQEVGRKLVSSSSDDKNLKKKNVQLNEDYAHAGKKPASEEDNLEWTRWKEYRKLKDRILTSRREISEFNVPMEDINKVLRQGQETANILAKEAAQYLSDLKGKSDYLFIQYLNAGEKKNKPKEAQEDEDVIYYEAENEDPEELVTSSSSSSSSSNSTWSTSTSTSTSSSNQEDDEEPVLEEFEIDVEIENEVSTSTQTKTVTVKKST